MKEKLESHYHLYWEKPENREDILSYWKNHLKAHPEDITACIEILLNTELKKTNPHTFLRDTDVSLAYKILSFALPKDETYFNQLDDYLSEVAQKAIELGFNENTTPIALRALNDPKFEESIDEQHRPQLTELKAFLEDRLHPIWGSKQLSFLLSHFAKIDLTGINWIERIRFLVDMSYANTSTPKRETLKWVVGALPPYNSNTCANIEAEFIRVKKLHQTIKTTSENWNKLDSDKARNTYIYRFKRNHKSQLNDIFHLLIEQEKNSPDFPEESSLFNRLFMSNYFNENPTDRQIISSLVWHLKKANIPKDEAEKIIHRFFKNNFKNESPSMESLITGYYKNIDPQIYTPTPGMATTQGGARGRYAEEGNQDTCLKTTLGATINTLTKKERGVIFKRSIAKLQQEHGQQEQQGSTAIACLVSGNTYDILNVGDSTAILGRKNKTTGHVTFEQINTAHNGNNTAEKRRLGRHKFNGTRLIVDPENPANRGLGSSRLIGYTQYPDVSHEPDTYHGTINVKDNEDVFIILASDGLSEADEYSVHTPGGFTEYLTERVNNFRGNLQQLPEYLIEKALEDGSTDNITVAVIPLNTKNTTPSVTAIFDGNNGDEVSAALQKNFQATLEAEIDNQNQINELLENLKKYRRIQGVRELVHILNNTALSSKEVLAQYEAELNRKPENADSIAERIENHNKAALEEIKKETEKFSDELKEEIIELSNKKTLGVIEITKQKTQLRNDLAILVNTLSNPEISTQVKLKDYGTRFFELGIVQEIKKHPSSAGQKFLIAVSVILALTGIGAIGMGIGYLATHKWLWERSEKERVIRTAEEKVKPYTPHTAPAA